MPMIHDQLDKNAIYIISAFLFTFLLMTGLFLSSFLAYRKSKKDEKIKA